MAGAFKLSRGVTTLLWLLFAATVVLVLSDTAGVLFNDGVVAAIRVGRAFEQHSSINVIDRADIPGQADQIGHFLFWGAAMGFVGWTLRRQLTIRVIALGLTALSLVLEASQPLFSVYRKAQLGDAVANVIGIVTAAAVVAVFARWLPRLGIGAVADY